MPLQKSLGIFSEADCSHACLQISSLSVIFPDVLVIPAILVLQKGHFLFYPLMWGGAASLPYFNHRGTLEAGRTVECCANQELCDWLFSPSEEAGYSIIVSVQVAALLLGKFQGLIEIFYIIDCRYPYEYLGGHIQVRLH